MFHPSLSESASISVRLINAMIGFLLATISVPPRIPRNRKDDISVMNAKVIVNTGGINPQMPKPS